MHMGNAVPFTFDYCEVVDLPCKLPLETAHVLLLERFQEGGCVERLSRGESDVVMPYVRSQEARVLSAVVATIRINRLHVAAD